mmetsp:Transcript_27321/g.83028  ORF Transcript_27321/g.83028 Transcript_27321/m.83028 type:complete len:100 (-) Transcript_27321:2713-3012(-)|eukprot:scaffold31318_cov28-Tisochrysis_lutea.AAC.7
MLLRTTPDGHVLVTNVGAVCMVAVHALQANCPFPSAFYGSRAGVLAVSPPRARSIASQLEVEGESSAKALHLATSTSGSKRARPLWFLAHVFFQARRPV